MRFGSFAKFWRKSMYGMNTNTETRHSTDKHLIDQSGTFKVFVYGTLKKDFPNHDHFLGNCKYLGVGSLEGIMFHIGAFPAINLSEQFSTILGEVYLCDWDHIEAMDRLEGINTGHYMRIKTPIENAAPEQGMASHGICYTYIYSRDRCAAEQWVIPGGMWLGTNTPKVKWAGFGKGVEIGGFETEGDELKIGKTGDRFFLVRSPLDMAYKLVNKKTGEVLGSYRSIVDQLKEGPRKILSLPSIQKPVETPATPVVWIPPPEKIDTEEWDIPQAARLAGLKYGAA